MRHESESNSNADNKDKKGDLMVKDENMEMKTEPLDADFSANSEVSGLLTTYSYFSSHEDTSEIFCSILSWGYDVYLE